MATTLASARRESSPEVVIVDAERAIALASDALTRRGTPSGSAVIQARHLAEGDLRGHPSHGLQRLQLLCERIESGALDPLAQPATIMAAPAMAQIDGRRGFGPVAVDHAMPWLLDSAQECGIAMVSISHANHLGMLAPYVERIAASDCVAIAMTTSEARVYPLHGTRAMIGTNPLAIGVPTDGAPFVLDIATAQVSMGQILEYGIRGEELEDGWAIDVDGRPTSRPGSAVAIAPFGGAKGYGLGLALELMVAALTQSALGQQVRGTLDATGLCNKGDVIVAISTRYSRGGVFGELSEYLRAVRDTPSQPGHAAVFIPGERSQQLRRQRLESGLPLPSAVWKAIVALGAPLDDARAAR